MASARALGRLESDGGMLVRLRGPELLQDRKLPRQNNKPPVDEPQRQSIQNLEMAESAQEFTRRRNQEGREDDSWDNIEEDSGSEEEGGYYTDDDDGIEVEVPYGAMPGETIDVRLPDGSVVHAMVPHGAEPGESFFVS